MLTTEQNAVVRAGIGNTVVFAAPGSGKTTVLTEHIMRQLCDRALEPSSLMVVTFTKQAAIELKRRLVSLGGLPRTQVEAIRVGTFHAQLFRLILEKKADVPVVLSPAEQTTMMRRAVESFTESSTAVVRTYLTELAKHKASWPVSTIHGRLKRILETYERLKRRAGRWDFDDIMLAFCEMWEENQIQAGCNWLRYCLNDEYQDTNQIQATILRMLTHSTGSAMFAVGDDDQCIYGFRGANPEWLINFEQHHDNAARHVLSTNFRSDSLIITHAAKLIGHNTKRVNKTVQGHRTDTDGVCRCWSWPDEICEAEAVVQQVGGVRIKQPSWSIAVLARTRLQLAQVAYAGQRAGLDGVEYRTCHEAKGREWDVVHMVGAVADNPYLNSAEGAERSVFDLEEERRLFYVAMTRARHHLMIHCPRRVKEMSVAVSPFVSEAGIECYMSNEGIIRRSIRSLLSGIR